MILGIWTIFSLGNSSDVFLILRAYDLGLTTTLTILAYVLYNFVYTVLSWPLGVLSDRLSRPLVLVGGLVVFAVVYLGFALATSAWLIWPLFAIYGIYIAATDGVGKALVGDYVTDRNAGTAYGLFAAVSGGALLIASITAGLLWSQLNSRAPFYLGATSSAVALLLLLGWLTLQRHGSTRPGDRVIS